MIEVSIIIPVYNKEKYIRCCLDSVLAQSFKNFEVVAVNDGSKDKSLEILQEYSDRDSRIKIFSIPNGGVSNARNIGLKNANGKWIQFLDGDDTIEADYLMQAVNIANETDTDILFSNFNMINEASEITKSISVNEIGLKNQAELCKIFIDNQYNNGYFGYISNKLFKRGLLSESGALFPVKTRLAEDLHFYAKLYPFVKKAFFWNGDSFSYLQTDSNYIHNSNIDYFTQIEIHIDIKEWFIASKQYEQYKAILDKKIAEYAFYILFYDNEDEKPLDDAFKYLTANEKIMLSIDPQQFDGFEKKILGYLKKGRLSAIKLSFAARNTVRRIYRMIKK